MLFCEPISIKWHSPSDWCASMSTRPVVHSLPVQKCRYLPELVLCSSAPTKGACIKENSRDKRLNYNQPIINKISGELQQWSLTHFNTGSSQFYLWRVFSLLSMHQFRDTVYFDLTHNCPIRSYCCDERNGWYKKKATSLINHRCNPVLLVMSTVWTNPIVNFNISEPL